jgi:hypothetical protein
MLHKIRIIQKGSGTTTLGVSIPKELKHWYNVFVSIKESGNCIVLESGALPTSFNFKQIKAFGEVVDKIKI